MCRPKIDDALLLLYATELECTLESHSVALHAHFKGCSMIPACPWRTTLRLGLRNIFTTQFGDTSKLPGSNNNLLIKYRAFSVKWQQYQ